MIPKLDTLDSVAIVTTLGALLFALALGAPPVGAIIGGIFTLVCAKGWVWFFRRLDRSNRR